MVWPMQAHGPTMDKTQGMAHQCCLAVVHRLKTPGNDLVDLEAHPQDHRNNTNKVKLTLRSLNRYTFNKVYG